MAVKQGDKDYLEAHSKAKLEFLKRYLDKYLKILILDKYTKKINIFDIFCGIGIYERDNSKGSPIIIADLLKSNIKNFNQNTTLLSFFINDINKQKINFVSSYINENYQGIFQFKSFSLDAKEIISEIKKIKYSNDTKNFIFIDPHGYKDLYKQDIYDLMNIGKTEILIFLPVSYMYRFLKPTKEDKENSSFRHIKRIMEEFKLEYDVNSIDEYIDSITKAFSFDNYFFTTNFKLKKDSSGNFYALFFITKNIYGLEKAIEAKWEIDEVCGKKFETKELHLFTKDFSNKEKENCLYEFKKKLMHYLQDFKTNIDIYKFTLQQGFLPKHTKSILKQYQKQNRLEFDRKVRKNSFYISYEYYKKNTIKYGVKIK